MFPSEAPRSYEVLAPLGAGGMGEDISQVTLP